MFIRKIKYKGGLLSMKDNAEMRKEHNAVREKVGYHDFTHELLEARGADVGAFMDKMFVNDISGADVGQGVYTTMLNEEGKIIDDLIILDRKSTRLNSSHVAISYAVFCLNK